MLLIDYEIVEKYKTRLDPAALAQEAFRSRRNILPTPGIPYQLFFGCGYRSKVKMITPVDVGPTSSIKCRRDIGL